MTATVITICWNAAKTIERTLASLLAQTALPAEFIAVDGGSTDGTLELLAKWSPRFRAAGIEFTVLDQEPHPGAAGIPSAWNQALRIAKGEIIALLNADDWYEPTALQEVGKRFADASVDAVSMAIMFRGDKDKLFAPSPLSNLPWKMPVPHPGCFFRKRVYDTIGLYDPRYKISADYDFIWRCRKLHWEYSTQPLVNMQLGGLANTSRAHARRETLEIARKNLPWWDLRPWMAFVFRWLLRR